MQPIHIGLAACFAGKGLGLNLQGIASNPDTQGNQGRAGLGLGSGDAALGPLQAVYDCQPDTSLLASTADWPLSKAEITDSSTGPQWQVLEQVRH